MKLKNIEHNCNIVIFSFYEYYGKEILGRLLKYLFSTDSYYGYMVFGDYLGGYDLSAYKSKYPLAEEESGIFRLEEEDCLNIDFIYKMLNSYHTASLYLNKDADFLLNLDNDAWRTFAPSLKDGYEIDMLLEYINLRVANDCSGWTSEFIHTTLGFEIMKQVRLNFPVFVFNQTERDIEEKELQHVFFDKKKYELVREDLIETNCLSKKLIVDSDGNLYKITRAHIVGYRPFMNLLFHRRSKRWFQVEFEYEDETKSIPIMSTSSFMEVARWLVKHKLAESKWND